MHRNHTDIHIIHMWSNIHIITNRQILERQDSHLWNKALHTENMSTLITVLKQFNSSVSKRLLYSLNALTVRGQANKESHSSLLVNIASFVQNSGLAIKTCWIKQDFKTVFFGKQALLNHTQVYLLSKVIISVYKFSFVYLSFQTLAWISYCVCHGNQAAWASTWNSV